MKYILGNQSATLTAATGPMGQWPETIQFFLYKITESREPTGLQKSIIYHLKTCKISLSMV